jgi:hypothetical protein
MVWHRLLPVCIGSKSQETGSICRGSGKRLTDAESKESRPRGPGFDLPSEGLFNVSCKYNRFLEYWSDGVMEKPIYANLFSRKAPTKHENLRIFLAADRINTPILLVVYYCRANCL